MTTIAWDGATVAADGKAVTGNGNVITLRERKLMVNGRVVYALTGAAWMFDALVAWARSTGDEPPKCEEEWTLIEFDGVVRFTSEKMAPHWVTVERAPWAWGSGTDLAIGAMLAGASARRAVEIACQVDNGSGGTITEIDLLTLRRSEAAE